MYYRHYIQKSISNTFKKRNTDKIMKTRNSLGITFVGKKDTIKETVQIQQQSRNKRVY